MEGLPTGSPLTIFSNFDSNSLHVLTLNRGLFRVCSRFNSIIGSLLSRGIRGFRQSLACLILQIDFWALLSH